MAHSGHAWCCVSVGSSKWKLTPRLGLCVSVHLFVVCTFVYLCGLNWLGQLSEGENK